LDAMGGDFAPKATIAGALLALLELDPAHTVQLVGQTAVIEAELKSALSGELSSAASLRDRIEIVEAPDVIEMNEKPTAGLRKKPNSSMIVGLKLQVDDKSDAFVSAGNTGAVRVGFLMAACAVQTGNAFAFRTTHDIRDVTVPVVALLRIVRGGVTVDAARMSQH